MMKEATVPTDTTAPSVDAVSPVDSTTDVAIDSSISATFSEAIDETSISTTTFTLSDGTNDIPGTVLYDDATKTATFDPTDSLLFGIQ